MPPPNWTAITVVGALLTQGAAVVWIVSTMTSDIKYNRGSISEVRSSTARLAGDIHENDVTIARIDANVEAIRAAIHTIVAQR